MNGYNIKLEYVYLYKQFIETIEVGKILEGLVTPSKLFHHVLDFSASFSREQLLRKYPVCHCKQMRCLHFKT